MDTKFKGKKFNLKVIVLVLAICLSILLSVGANIKEFIADNNAYTHTITSNAINNVYTSVKNLTLYTDGLYGDLREDSVNAEVQYIKSNIERYLNGESTEVETKYLDMPDDAIKGNVIHEFTWYVKSMNETIERNPNVEFYVENKEGQKAFTNVDVESKEEFEKDTLNNYKEYIIIKPGRNIKTSVNLGKILDSSVDLDQDYDVYLRIAQPLKEGDGIYNIVKNYESKKVVRDISIVAAIISLIVVAFCIIKLKNEDFSSLLKSRIVKFYSKIDIEIKVLVVCIVFWNVVDIIVSTDYYLDKIVGTAIAIIPIYLFLLEVIRLKDIYDNNKLKDEFFKKSVIKMGIKYLKYKNMWIKLLFILINMVIISDAFVVSIIISRKNIRISFLCALTVALIIMSLIFRYLESLKEIEEGSRKISQGAYDYEINVGGSKALTKIGENLENIQDGLKTAVNKATKSERMKAELITNVSHDLKTPLTSIISYIDLLSQENITEEQKAKYLSVLKDKSNRLKVLIEDLFEVSKASSGSVELHMENLDPVSLLRQTLGEFEDKIEKSDIKIIKQFPEEKFIVFADGRKTFRVFQNLISNILKYSMKGSRVYIEVNNEEEYVEIIFKNTSGEELNFTEEEILQRFKRGDASRSTEGSGLGLAIAKSLTEVQKGTFDIKIDGDLFKAIVRLRKGNNLNEVKC